MADDLAVRLLERAEGMTLKRLKREGELMPGILLYSKERGYLVVELPWRSAAEKVALLDALRAMMSAARVEAYAIWSECWLSKRQTTGKAVDVAQAMRPETMPSTDPDRIDAVVIIAAERGKPAAMRMWEITKDARGRVKLERTASTPDQPDLLAAGRLGDLLAPPAFDA